MTVRMPPTPVAVPSLVVEPGSIHDCGADLLAASAQVDDLGSFVAGPARIPAWTGDGGGDGWRFGWGGRLRLGWCGRRL